MQQRKRLPKIGTTLQGLGTLAAASQESGFTFWTGVPVLDDEDRCDHCGGQHNLVTFAGGPIPTPIVMLCADCLHAFCGMVS